MFGNKLKARNQKLELENESLVETNLDLKKQNSDLEITKREELAAIKLKNKIADEDIKHMQKMKDEARNIEFQKKEIELQAQNAEGIAKVKDEYRDKLETQLSKETENIKTMYGQILERLPKINVKGTI